MVIYLVVARRICGVKVDLWLYWTEGSEAGVFIWPLLISEFSFPNYLYQSILSCSCDVMSISLVGVKRSRFPHCILRVLR